MAAMTLSFIRNLTSSHRSRDADTCLGAILAFTGGAVNAGAFIALGSYTSHMTGLVSQAADNIAFGRFGLAGQALLAILCFTAGAVTSSVVINWARHRKYNSEFALAILIEALLLFSFAMAAIAGIHLSLHGAVVLLCFTMGLQNAIISKISQAVIRTTHVTGLITDIGIETGRRIYRFFSKNQDIPVYPEKMRLHVMLLSMFFTGGILGAFLFFRFGGAATLPFAVLLAIMASGPIMADMKAGKKQEK